MDNDDIMQEPLTQQPEWFTEEQLDKIELELIKEASAPHSPVDLSKKRSEEEAMLERFRKEPSPNTFMPLYNSMKPFVMRAASMNMVRSQIPKAAHEMQAAQSFMDAARTYKKEKGSSFRTHAFTTVFEKGKRLNLKYQNIDYQPEARATKYQHYQNAIYVLREQLGREPSDIELADELSLPVVEIERMRKEINRDLIEQSHFSNRGLAFAQTDRAMQAARDIYPTLEPKHQLVMEYTFGLNGKPSLVKKSGKSDITAIAKAAGIKLSDVRSARKTIKRKLMGFRAFMGKADMDNPIFDESDDE